MSRHVSHQESAISFISRTKLDNDCLSRLLAFHSSIGSVADIAGGGALTLALEEASEDWLKERSENDLSTVGDWEGHPQDQDELENVVER